MPKRKCKPMTMDEAKAHMIANHRALETHLSRELRRFMKAFTDGMQQHAEVSLRDSSLVQRARSTPGEGRNFQTDTGTGGGSTARESTDLEFS